MIRILLLGPDGQLGTDLLRRAEDRRDLHVTPLYRADLDVSDVQAIAPALATQRFDVLINTTSYHRTDEVESHADRAVTINAHAVHQMAHACQRQGARFVHLSTDYVFDGAARTPYRENDNTGPLNVYGATKRMGETLARSACSNVLIFRTASLFGVAGASGKGGNFVETMIRVGREKGALRVIADQFMSPTSTEDLAAIILAALHQQAPPGIYHAVNSGRASWYEFARQIIQQAGVEASIEPIPASDYPLPAPRPAFSVLDNGRLADLVGPIPHWREALDRYLAAKGHAVTAA